MNHTQGLLWIGAAVVPAIMPAACWDQPEHELDVDGITDTHTAKDADTGNDSVAFIDTATGDTATDSVADTGGRNSLLPSEWAGFGAACDVEAQCTGYPSQNMRCIQDVMGLVNSPAGYCTACCNEPGVGVCGPNIDCVGASNAFLICLARCGSNDDCRTEDGYECHEGLYYMESIFSGKYCLPDAAHIAPDTDGIQQTTCPWPWL